MNANYDWWFKYFGFKGIFLIYSRKLKLSLWRWSLNFIYIFKLIKIFIKNNFRELIKFKKKMYMDESEYIKKSSEIHNKKIDQLKEQGIIAVLHLERMMQLFNTFCSCNCIAMKHIFLHLNHSDHALVSMLIWYSVMTNKCKDYKIIICCWNIKE